MTARPLLYSSLFISICVLLALPLSILGRGSELNVRSIQSTTKQTYLRKYLAYGAGCGILLNTVQVASAVELDSLSDTSLKKTLFNIPPRQTVYPSNFDGVWSSSLNFEGAKFCNDIPFASISENVNVAGFRKYSIAQISDIGSDINNLKRKWIRSDRGDIVEDVNFNLKSSISKIMDKYQAEVDNLDYEPKKDPNRCSLTYHDVKGSGKIELFTNSRSNSLTADGSFLATEQIRQSSVRRSLDLKRRPSQILGDYSLQWLYSPQTNPDLYTGRLLILSYLLPQDELYFKRPSSPIAQFTYSFTMARDT